MNRAALEVLWLPLLKRLEACVVSDTEIHARLQRYDGCRASESSVHRWLHAGVLPRAENLRFLERACRELEEIALASKPHRLSVDEEGRVLWDGAFCPLRYEAESFALLKAGATVWEPK